MLWQLGSDRWVWQVSHQLRGSLSAELVLKMSHWRQKFCLAREAGGLILGFIDTETGGLLAETITTPSWGDQRSRTSFYRGPRHQSKALEWHYHTGERGTTIGLWHTHPECIPSPSGTDLNDLANVLAQGSYGGLGLIYVIVGTEKAGCWFGERNGKIHKIGFLSL